MKTSVVSNKGNYAGDEDTADEECKETSPLLNNGNNLAFCPNPYSNHAFLDYMSTEISLTYRQKSINVTDMASVRFSWCFVGPKQSLKILKCSLKITLMFHCFLLLVFFCRLCCFV